MWKDGRYPVLPICVQGYVEKGEKSGEERSYNILSLQDRKITDVTQTEITGAEKAKLMPTDTGTVVNDFLMEYFPNILLLRVFVDRLAIHVEETVEFYNLSGCIERIRFVADADAYGRFLNFRICHLRGYRVLPYQQYIESHSYFHTKKLNEQMTFPSHD